MNFQFRFDSEIFSNRNFADLKAISFRVDNSDVRPFYFVKVIAGDRPIHLKILKAIPTIKGDVAKAQLRGVQINKKLEEEITFF